MRQLYFADVRIGESFWIDGAEFIKIDPIVLALNVFANATLADHITYFWFDDNQIVEVNRSLLDAL